MPTKDSRLRSILRAVAILATALALLALAFVAYANITAIWASRGRTFSDVASVPHTKIALVFGTTHRVDGRENLFFRYRIDAAAALWHAGKIETLIVSGDNRTVYYNEPEQMRQALVSLGVPNDRIVCDYAGLRTLDSVVRAKKVFGAASVLFISQRFQNERAIYLARAHGIDARAYNARDPSPATGMKTHIREVGARVKMFLDVHFLGTRPRHLGPKEPMPQ